MFQADLSALLHERDLLCPPRKKNVLSIIELVPSFRSTGQSVFSELNYFIRSVHQCKAKLCSVFTFPGCGSSHRHVSGSNTDFRKQLISCECFPHKFHCCLSLDPLELTNSGVFIFPSWHRPYS